MSKRKRSVQDNGEIGGDVNKRGEKKVKSCHAKSEGKTKEKDVNLRGGHAKIGQSPKTKDDKVARLKSITHANLGATQSRKRSKSESRTNLPHTKPEGSKSKLREKKKGDGRNWTERIQAKGNKGTQSDIVLVNSKANQNDSKRAGKDSTNIASTSGTIWTASASIGGYQLNIDPVFSFDEEYGHRIPPLLDSLTIRI